MMVRNWFNLVVTLGMVLIGATVTGTFAAFAFTGELTVVTVARIACGIAAFITLFSTFVYLGVD